MTQNPIVGQNNPKSLGKKKMNIGFESKRVFNNFTGLGNYSRTLITNLAEFYPTENYLLYTPKIKNSAVTKEILQNPSFQTIVSKSKLKAYWRSYGITKELENSSIDIFHGLSHEVPFNIKNSKVKSVVTIHDLIFKYYPNTYPWIDRKIYDLKFRKSCQQADVIIAISENTKKDIIQFYDIPPEKIKVVYQSCNPIYFEPLVVSPEDVAQKYNLPSKYFLFVGSVETRKNVQLILKAYQHLSQEAKLPLVIVGRPSQDQQSIRTLIKTVGLTDKVIWLQNLENNKHLQAIYHQASALIYPSLYEGFGLPIVEALLSKTPVITANTSSLPEAAGPDSLLIDPASPEDLAQAMEKILEPNLSQTMITKGYEYAIKNFGRKATADNLMRLYREIVKK